MTARRRTRYAVPACLCGRFITARTDGLRRRHRIEDSPAAPWCAGSDQPVEETR